MKDARLFNRWDAVVAACYRGICKHAWLRRALSWQAEIPDRPQITTDGMRIEIVSHCWNYAHLLRFQLHSLIRHPPTAAAVTMTVFYNDSDDETKALLDWCGQQIVEGVTWQFLSLPPFQLFRRAIGRNHAATTTRADWIWFTDCDVIFGEKFLDALASELDSLDHPLVYPQTEQRTPPLPPDHPWLAKNQPPDISPGFDAGRCQPFSLNRATGPMQIVRADVARSVGYCRQPAFYQKPAAHWCKATEDRVFRWTLGTQGIPITASPVYRIQHQTKGRYHARGRILQLISRIRSALQTHRIKKISSRQSATLQGRDIPDRQNGPTSPT